MKPAKFLTLLIIHVSLLAGLMSSCSSSDEPDGVIYDIAPVNFKIEVEDLSGNIIDPKSDQWEKLLQSTSVEYDGVTYLPSEFTGVLGEYKPLTAIPESRYIPAFFLGLHYLIGGDRGELYFGQFPRDENYSIEFKVNWPDGKSSDVRFENKITWKNKNPKILSQLWIDGEKQQNISLLPHRMSSVFSY